MHNYIITYLTVLGSIQMFAQTTEYDYELKSVRLPENKAGIGLYLFKNLIYFKTDNEIWTYCPSTNQTSLVATGLDTFKLNGHLVGLDDDVYVVTLNGSLYKHIPGTFGVDAVANGYEDPGTFNWAVGTLHGFVYYQCAWLEICAHDPNTKTSAHVFSLSDHINQILGFNDSLYIGTSRGIYEYNIPKGQYNQILGTESLDIMAIVPVFAKGEAYIALYHSNIIYLYTFETGKFISLGFKNIGTVPIFGIVGLENILYHSSGNSVIIRNATGTHPEIKRVELEDEILSMVNYDNKIYIGTTRHIYELSSKFCKNLKTVLSNNIIDYVTSDSYSETFQPILKSIQFLNPNVDITLLSVTQFNNSAATVKSKPHQNEYCGETEVFYKSTENVEKHMIDLQQLIEIGIVGTLKRKLNGKEDSVRNLNTIQPHLLVFSDIEATMASDIKYETISEEVCFGRIMYAKIPCYDDGINATNLQLPECRHSTKVIINEEINKVLTKCTAKNERDAESMKSWHEKLGQWPFVDVDLLPGFNKVNDIVTTVSLGRNWPNLNGTQPYEFSLSDDVVPGNIIVPCGNSINVTAISKIEIEKVTLNLTQTIRGYILGTYVDSRNEELMFWVSVKDIMFHLKSLDLLPTEIEFNADDSITFHSQLKRTWKKTTKPVIRYTKYDMESL